MTKKPPGPKEQQRIDLRLKRYQERGPGSGSFLKRAVAASLPAIKKQLTEAVAKAISKPSTAPVQASAPTQETTMKKPKKKGAKLKAVSTGKADTFKVAGLKQAKKKAAPKADKPVPALDVAKFMARDGGASMEELVKEFGIQPHPMRAKVHYIRNNIPGWDVENRDGRYYATGPKAA